MKHNAGALALVWAAACAAPSGSSAGSTGNAATEGGTTSGTSTGGGTTGESTSTDDGSSSDMPPPVGDVPIECIVYVDPGGDDADDCGTESAPCRTFTHAIALAGDGCTIALGPGTYSAATGEAPPWAPGPDVHVVGAGAAETILDDLASASTQPFAIECDGGEPPVRAAVALEGGSLRSLSVLGPVETDYRTVLVLGGSVEIEAITVVGGQEGIFVTGDAEVSIVGVDVSGAGHAAIKPAGDATVTVESSRMHHSKDAVEPICRATTTVRESEAYCNGNGLEALDRAHTTLVDNDVHHNVNGIAARGTETMVVARGNTVHDNAFAAVIIFAGFDAGTADDPGGNTFGPSQFVGVALANVPTDTFAVGNTWMPSIDGADGSGAYAAGTVVDGPLCTAHMSEIELPPPDPCDVDVPVTPVGDVQNFALRDGSCDDPPSCGGGLPACPATGALILGP